MVTHPLKQIHTRAVRWTNANITLSSIQLSHIPEANSITKEGHGIEKVCDSFEADVHVCDLKQ